MNEPWLIKDITRAWESCVRDAILDYAQAIGGGTFDAFGWESCWNQILTCKVAKFHVFRLECWVKLFVKMNLQCKDDTIHAVITV